MLTIAYINQYWIYNLITNRYKNSTTTTTAAGYTYEKYDIKYVKHVFYKINAATIRISSFIVAFCSAIVIGICRTSNIGTATNAAYIIIVTWLIMTRHNNSPYITVNLFWFVILSLYTRTLFASCDVEISISLLFCYCFP